MTISRGWRCWLVGAAFVAFGFAGCDRRPGPAQVPEGQAATYEVRGIVRQVSQEQRSAIIAHESIPGYMTAMAMEFAVPGPDDLAKLQPGEKITFRLSVTDRRSWIDRVQTTGAIALAVPPEPAVDGLATGVMVPDVALVDQRGRPFRLSEFKGRALAFSFIFTRCPLPDFCPRMNEQFSEAQRQLPGTGNGWHLLSVSIDPTHDTPERLTAYAPRFRVDPAHWTMATGEPGEIEKLANAFGLQIAREGAELNHTLRTVVVDPAGRVQKIFKGNGWTVSELVAEMQRASAAPAP